MTMPPPVTHFVPAYVEPEKLRRAGPKVGEALLAPLRRLVASLPDDRNRHSASIHLCALPNCHAARVALTVSLRHMNGDDGNPRIDLDTLDARMADVRGATVGKLSWFVEDLSTGEVTGHHADEPLYLASTFKMFVLLAVMDAYEDGTLTPQTKCSIEAHDYLDGSPCLNYRNHRPGRKATIRELLLWMMKCSDNTATDLLIDCLGPGKLDTTAANILGSDAMGHLVSMLECRRRLWSQLHPKASQLVPADFITLKEAPDLATRLQRFAEMVGMDVPPTEAEFRQARERFFAAGHNTATLSQLGTVLNAVARHKILTPIRCQQILELMGQCETGRDRLMAGFPERTTFAHKTGTLDPRMLDFGVVTLPDERQVIIAASISDFDNRPDAARALESLGRAVFWF